MVIHHSSFLSNRWRNNLLLKAADNIRSLFSFCPVLIFTLYSRAYCHLCHEMQTAFDALALAVPHRLEVVDVDADPELVARYDEWVPVLTGTRPDRSSVQLCHYRLDVDAVTRFIADSA